MDTITDRTVTTLTAADHDTYTEPDGIRAVFYDGPTRDRVEVTMTKDNARALMEELAFALRDEDIPTDTLDAVRAVLASQEALHCTRSWDAWSYGTMTSDDFVNVADGDDAVIEIARAALGMQASQAAPVTPTDIPGFEGTREALDALALIPNDSPVMLTYELCKAMPLGSVVADAEGYWNNIDRHYVKTSSATWAVFFHRPTGNEIAEVVRERRNNLSPCPSGYLALVYPATDGQVA